MKEKIQRSKAKTLFTFIICLVAIIITCSYLLTPSHAVYNGNLQTEKIVFDYPCKLSELENEVQKYDVNTNDIISIINISRVGENTYTGGYTLKAGADLSAAILDYKYQYFCGLQDTVEELQQLIPTIEQESIKESAQTVLHDYLVRLDEYEKEDDIMIYGIIVKS